MKRLLFGGFIALSLLRLSYAEPSCKDDLDCFGKYAHTNNVSYLVYGCLNYKNQSHGYSCTKLYSLSLDQIAKDIVDFCNKGNSLACTYKITYNLDGKFRDETSTIKEMSMILKQSEQRCENEEYVMECIVAYQVYKLLGNSKKTKYYYDKAFKIFMNME
jgi:hypothetical protein